jgi:hypothetical protein
MRVFSALFIVFALYQQASAQEVSAKLTRGPYLQLATPSSIHIVWRTVGDTTPIIRYGLDLQHQDQAVEGAAVFRRKVAVEGEASSDNSLHSAPEGTVQYEVAVTKLEADTKYFYSVWDGSKQLAGGEEFFFRTHPAPGTVRPIRVWVVGDSGTADARQAAVYSAMQTYVKDQNRPLDLYLHVGDMAYPSGTDDEFQKTFFEIYQPTLRNTVCWASMGNHEGDTSKGMLGVGPYYDAYICPKRGEAGGLPSASEAFYSFDYANAHFICLDSHDLDRAPTGVMAQWLRADLEKTKSDWIIAYFHHPPYTKGSHDSDKEEQLIEMRELIMPILEAGGVDLVLTGHSHIYERSMLIDGAYQTPTVAEGVVLDDGDGDPNGEGPYRKSKGLHPHEGVVQVVTGNGGAKVSRVGTSPVMKKVLVEYGSTILDINGDTLNGVMVNRAGETRDLFSIVKQGTVERKIVASPRVLPLYSVPVGVPKIEKSELAPFPRVSVELIKPNAEWDYLAGSHAAKDWTAIAYIPDEAVGWKSGVMGIGYGDNDDVTELKDMKGQYLTVYSRKDFELSPGEKDKIADLGLAISYDDGFIAYLNGQEVLRVNVKSGRGSEAKGIKSHEADGYEYFPLEDATKFLTDDENILSIEGHNDDIKSSDFTLDAYLLAVPK